MAAMPGGATKIEIPRWIQLVGLPLLLLLIWVVAGAARHVVFLFLVAALLALLLNPLVRGLGRVWIPRGLAVAIVYLSFAGAVGLAVVALATVVVNQTRNSADRVDTYFTVEHGQSRQTHAQRDLDRFQLWLDHHHLKQIKVRQQGQDFLNNIGTKDVQKYTSKAISWAEGAAISVFQLLFSTRSEEHTSELQSPCNLVCRLLLEKKTTHAAILTVRSDGRPGRIPLVSFHPKRHQDV